MSSFNRAVGLAMMMVLAPTVAQAQGVSQNISAERLRPAIDENGIIDVEWASVPDHLAFNLGAWAWYAHNPMVLHVVDRDGTATRVQTLVENRLGGSLIASLGLFQRVQLGVELPYVLFQARPDADTSKPGAALVGDQLQAAGFGDLRLSPKIALWRTKQDDAPFDIAVIPTVTLPTAALLNDVILGGGDTRWMGEPAPTFAPELAVSRALGSLRLAGNVGYRLRFPSENVGLIVGSELFYRIGVAYRTDSLLKLPLEVGTSLSGQTGSLNSYESNHNPLEWLAQVKYDVLPFLQAHVGGGLGAIGGYATPDFRVFAGMQFVPPSTKAPEPEPQPEPEPEPQPEPEPEPQPEPEPESQPEPAPQPEPAQPEPAPLNSDEARKPKVTITREKIEILEMVYFDVGNATIQQRSYALLDQVVKVLKENPNLTKIRIEGHTDSDGSDASNMILSQRRTESVKQYLVDGGVEASRLEPKGYGESHPKVLNTSKRNKEKNRRVEFAIVEVDGKAVDATTSTKSP